MSIHSLSMPVFIEEMTVALRVSVLITELDLAVHASRVSHVIPQRTLVVNIVSSRPAEGLMS